MARPEDFNNLNFESFKSRASNTTLSRHEKVGFPDEYREGKEGVILGDMRAKLQALDASNKIIMEIGPGCSQLPLLLSELCQRQCHRLVFVDSAEMLSHIPDVGQVEKWPGRYPAIPGLFEKYASKVDVIMAYSVIQYVFAEGNLWDCIDKSLSLLANGGEMLLGDIPNITMRKRFFSSSAGRQCHRSFTGRDELPEVHFNQLEPGQIDDSVIFAILSRARAQGFHAWVIPQAPDLPMANRREDILIRKP